MSTSNRTLSPQATADRQARNPDDGLGTRFMRGKIDRNSAILELAASFPTLRSSVEGWDPKRWDIDVFMSDVEVICSGARNAKLFVASVWDPSGARAQGMEFRVVDAISTWDREHKVAFLQWCFDPFWP